SPLYPSVNRLTAARKPRFEALPMTLTVGTEHGETWRWTTQASTRSGVDAFCRTGGPRTTRDWGRECPRRDVVARNQEDRIISLLISRKAPEQAIGVERPFRVFRSCPLALPGGWGDWLDPRGGSRAALEKRRPCQARA